MSQLPLVFDRSKYRADFAAWLMANQPIWLAFCAKADALWDRGRRHYGARALVEVLRYESSLREAGGMFKINGNYIPDLARLYMETHGRDGFFETRVMPGAARAA